MTPADPRVARVAGLFDAVAPAYDTTGVDFFQPIATGLVAALRPRPGDRVLDIGCGRGAALLAAARATAPGGTAVGIDISPAMVRQCLAAIDDAGLANATATVGDAQDPVVAEAAFDIVSSSLVLFFLPEPQEAVRRWRSLLRPGGRVGITTFGRIDPRWVEVDEVFAPYLPPDLRDARTNGTTGPFGSDEGMQALLEGAGYRDVSTVRETVHIRFESPDQWVAFTTSTGQWAMWQAVPEATRPVVRAEAEQRLRAHADADGSVTFSQDVRHTIAVSP